MNLVMTLVLLVVGVPVTIVSLYLFVLTVLSYFPRRLKADGPPLRIAMLIPAHNEEHQIASVVKSALAVDYPREAFTIFVISDNCSDATAALAREAGAEAAERHDPDHPGKGQAIEWFLRTHREILEGFDAITFADADSTIDRHYLREISGSLRHPKVSAVQGYHGVANPQDNWRTALTWAGFVGVNHVRLAGQSRLSGTVSLKGNGMAFRTPLLLSYGWPAHSIVEDLELAVQLLLDGTPIAYNGDAIVISEMPAGGRQAQSQRRRWEGGRVQLVRAYGPRLIGAFLRRGGVRFLDTLMELCMPPLSLLVMLQGLFLLMALASLRLPWVALAVGCVVATALYVTTCLYQRKAPARVWLALLTAPYFIVWKIPIYIGLMVRGQKTWERTTRKAELASPKAGNHGEP